jgi:hypothetical protein
MHSNLSGLKPTILELLAKEFKSKTISSSSPL